MDCSRGLLLSLGLILFATGCQKAKTAQEVFPVKSDECEAQAVKTRFIVRWLDGRRTVEKGQSRDQFLREFVEPNLDKLEFVEHDEFVSAKDANFFEDRTRPLNGWGVEAVQAEAAWKQGLRGQGVTVAVVDSGMDRRHGQLASRLATNSGETGTDRAGRDRRTNGVDDDGNGFIDDWAGYDFVNRSGFVEDTSEHGTHVSGIIAAYHEDSDYVPGTVQGIAPEARILPLDFISGEGGFISDAIEAMEYAVMMGARVINASWGGGPCSKSLADLIASLEQKDVLFVVAAGNDSLNIDQFRQYPASHLFPAQITVGSITQFGDMADHSNYGDRSVHLFAPGFEIFSTIPGNTYDAFSGTSMATPFVAGAAALLFSQKPDATIAEVREALLSSVDRNADYRNVTKGRLNIARAIRAL